MIYATKTIWKLSDKGPIFTYYYSTGSLLISRGKMWAKQLRHLHLPPAFAGDTPPYYWTGPKATQPLLRKLIRIIWQVKSIEIED